MHSIFSWLGVKFLIQWNNPKSVPSLSGSNSQNPKPRPRFDHIHNLDTGALTTLVDLLLEFNGLATSKYQDGYQLVTVYTHGNFIVLLHWETRLPAP